MKKYYAILLLFIFLVNSTVVVLADNEQTLSNGTWSLEVDVTGEGDCNVPHAFSSGTWSLEVNVTGVPSTPQVIQNCTHQNEIPENNTGTYPINPTLNISISQPEGKRFNWTIKCENGDSNTGSNFNGTYTLNVSGLSYKTWYWWNVSSDVSGNWTTTQYNFKTNTDPAENASAILETIDSGTWSLTIYLEYYLWSDWSDWWVMTYSPSSFDHPSSFTASNYNDTGINLSWVINSNASSTVVRYKKGSYPTLNTGTLLCNDTNNSFNHSNLDVGTAYYYSAWSYNDTLGIYSDYAHAIGYTNPLQPTNIQTTSTGMTSIGLSWNKGTNATNTVIIMNESGYSHYPTHHNNGTIMYNNSGSSASIESLDFNTTYYFTFLSYNPSSHLFSLLNTTYNESTIDSADTPSNLNVDSFNDTKIILNWTKGSDYTIIRRNTGSYPTLSTGTEVYNGTGATYNDRGLTPATHYYYRAWGWNGEAPSTGFSSHDNITLPSPPQNLIGSISGTTLTITWDKGTGATRTILRNDTGSYPDIDTGNLVYNNTGEIKTVTGVDDIDYYRGWSYAKIDGVHLYSKYSNLLWGGIEIWCFNENNNSENLTFDVVISNPITEEVFTHSNCVNPYRIDVADVPNSQDSDNYITIQVSADGFHLREYTMLIYENNYYLLYTYLPPDAPGTGGGTGGGDPDHPDYDENESYAELYEITVVDEYDVQVDDVIINIKKIVNQSGVIQYESVSTVETGADGTKDVWLIPSTLYLVTLSKSGFITEVDTWTASPLIFTKEFRITHEEQVPDETDVTSNETLWTGITYNIDPSKKYHNTSIYFYYNISSSDSKLEYFNMSVYYYDNSTGIFDLLYTVNSTSASGGGHSYETSDTQGKYLVICKFKKTNYSEYFFGYNYYFIYTTVIPGEIEELPDFVWMLLTVVLMIAGMALSIKARAGDLCGLVGIIIMAIMFSLRPGLTLSGISCWIILLITVLAYGIYMFITRRN